MTTHTQPLPLLEQLKAYLRYARTPKINKTIIDYLVKPTKPSVKLEDKASQFWQVIHQAVNTGKLTWTLISDTPSTLIDGMITLNHERITALLDEQGLPFADLSAIEFGCIIKHTYPQAIAKFRASEYSQEIRDGQTAPEQRLSYKVSLKELSHAK